MNDRRQSSHYIGNKTMHIDRMCVWAMWTPYCTPG